MALISFSHKGEFTKTNKFFARMLEASKPPKTLDYYGQSGLDALMQATPRDTGKTAASWRYGVEQGDDSYTIYWTNDNVNDGVNIAVILQYGHGTRNGGYVRGIDYINPAIRPIFDEISQEAWKEVSRV